MNRIPHSLILAALKQHVVKLPNGHEVRVLGQGTWRMGDDESKRDAEIEALQTGLDCGLHLIDTAEMYGEGKAESLVGEAIQDRREDVFLVSKVYPHNAGGDKLVQACDATLKRLGTDYLDLYLLHWRGNIPLEETVDGLEQLKADGKIRAWGVSNFDVDDMKELLALPNGKHCAVNQVLYHLGSRGVEYDLLPFLQEQGIPMMAYSPLAEGSDVKADIFEDETVNRIAKAYSVTPAQILLAWTVRSGHVIAIPKAGQKAHVEENGAAMLLNLSEDDLNALDEAFPPPSGKEPLDII
ncbi:aldo/keto reductase [Exiguobacterium chiriqhucha]|uniref:Aldo/keto reductase n=1 Tax=Exiguobacterium chiriqhucha RW-2 TaxID=1345023 RepID=U1LZX4_9BACL|nr:aldo/keto reductase [Exiguobacterium chiriqhucha]ERG67957.1 aldo/keto reductase [Exiguobacterium chiriqhucha RW-2]